MAIFRCFLLSRSAISIHPPLNTLISFQFYTSSSDPPQSINCNPKLVNHPLSDSDSETLIKGFGDCEEEPPCLLEMVKRASQKVTNPDELEHFRKKKKKERDRDLGFNMIDEAKLPPPFDSNKKPKGPPSLQELFKRKPSSQYFMMKSTLAEVEFRNVLIEAQKNPKCTVEEFCRMLADGVPPNADAYAVLIRKLADEGDEGMLKEAKKSLLEMVEKRMKPSLVVYTDMFEALVEGGKEAEAREVVEMMKGKGFEFDEKGVRELLKWKIKTGDVSAGDVISILFGKRGNDHGELASLNHLWQTLLPWTKAK